MSNRSLACAAVLALVPLAGAAAQGNLSPGIPAADKVQANEMAIGHSDRHRPFFYWLFGDSSETVPAATPVASTAPAAGAVSPAPAAPATAPVMKTGTAIGTK